MKRIILVFLSIGLSKADGQFQNMQSTFLGGSVFESALDICIGPDLSIYVCGWTTSPNLAFGEAFQSFFAGSEDAYVAKFDSNMSLVWLTYFGGSLEDAASDIALLADGTLVITGNTNSSSGIVTSDGLQITSGESFILCMNQSGERIWSSYYYPNAFIEDIASIGSNDMVISGQATSESDIATEGSEQAQCAGPTDGFITRISSSGEIVWSTYFGDSGEENLISMDVDDDIIYCVGSTNSATGLSHNCIEGCEFAGGSNDAVLVSFNTSGEVIRSRYFGGEGLDNSFDIAAEDNKILIGGTTYSSTGINLGEHILIETPSDDFATFTALFDAELTVIWGTYIDDVWPASVLDVEIDSVNGIWVVGRTENSESLEFESSTTYGGDDDGMIANFLPTGELVLCGFLPAGELYDQTTAIAHYGSNMFLAGNTFSQDLTVSEDAWQPEHAGSSDGLIMRFALPVGVEEWPASSVSPVYPNPAVDQLTIPASAMTGVQELYVCDLAGRSVLHQSAHLPGAATLHITSLQPGMYTIRAHNAAGQAVWVQRWVKG
jgi:hypothetical protein